MKQEYDMVLDFLAKNIRDKNKLQIFDIEAMFREYLN